MAYVLTLTQMNSVTVLQASHGLGQYIINQQQQHLANGVTVPSVVIGYDARYNSEKFARLSAAAFLAKVRFSSVLMLKPSSVSLSVPSHIPHLARC
jgi:phosphomannomutase